MSNSEFKTHKHNLVFMCAFHTGIPLAIARTQRYSGWYDINKKIAAEFSSLRSWKLMDPNYDPETNFPLGKPVFIDSSLLSSVLVCLLKHENVDPSHWKVESMVWILPTGVVLLIYKISSPTEKIIELDKLKEIIDRHYAEFSCIFVEIAEIIYRIFPEDYLSSSAYSQIYLERSKTASTKLKAYSKQNREEEEVYVEELFMICKQEKINQLLSDLLIDVYYIDIYPDGMGIGPDIGYVSSIIRSSDALFPLHIEIAYASFVNLLWLLSRLNEDLREAQNQIVSSSRNIDRKMLSELKIFRIYCLEFISESQPIAIRLTFEYMKIVENCWEKFRMHELSEQVNKQIDNLEKIFEWAKDQREEIRDWKIQIAAIIIALISTSAVAAELISTLDINAQLGLHDRALLVSLGTLIGFLITTLIYILPFRRKL